MNLFKLARLFEIKISQLEQDKLLYHVSGWDHLSSLNEGDSFILNPGPQGAEGPGVYFSENKPRFSAAEGAVEGISAVVFIKAPPPQDFHMWYRTKMAFVKKFNRPRTWHTKNKSIKLTIRSISYENDIPYLFCDGMIIS